MKTLLTVLLLSQTLLANASGLPKKIECLEETFGQDYILLSLSEDGERFEIGEKSYFIESVTNAGSVLNYTGVEESLGMGAEEASTISFALATTLNSRSTLIIDQDEHILFCDLLF